MWEVKLRHGVTFHNGKTFGADDVIYSIQQMAKPANSGSYPFVSGIDVANMKALSKNLVRIPLKTPDADLSANFTYYNTWIVQNGETDFKNPVGTGPFKFVVVHARPAERLQEEPELLGDGQAVRRLAQDPVDLRPHRAPERAALRARSTPWRSCRSRRPRRTRRRGDINVLVATSPQAMMFYMDTPKPPFIGQPRAPGVPADRRPPGPDRRRDHRLRHGRQRHRRQGAAVLRLDAAAARRRTSRRPRPCSRRPATRT